MYSQNLKSFSSPVESFSGLVKMTLYSDTSRCVARTCRERHVVVRGRACFGFRNDRIVAKTSSLMVDREVGDREAGLHMCEGGKVWARGKRDTDVAKLRV